MILKYNKSLMVVLTLPLNANVAQHLSTDETNMVTRMDGNKLTSDPHMLSHFRITGGLHMNHQITITNIKLGGLPCNETHCLDCTLTLSTSTKNHLTCYFFQNKHNSICS